MIGITDIGAYVPQARLQRAAMADAIGWLTPGLPDRGSRTMAFWDEDSTTMAHEAARVIRPAQAATPDYLDFCTTTPAFVERQNASLLHAALALPARVNTQELGATTLSGLSALHRHLEAGTEALVACADRPISSPGSHSEFRSGDGAACARVGRTSPVLQYLGGAATTDPFTEKFRAAGACFSTEWEERWVREVGWQRLVADTMNQALDGAGIEAADVHHLIVGSPMSRIGKLVAKSAGLTKATIADDLLEEVGYCGTAQPLLMLAHHAPKIRAGQNILVSGLGQGSVALLFRANGPIEKLSTGLQHCASRARAETVYTKLHLFSGLLPWDPGHRGKTPVMEALTTAQRYSPALLSFTGSRCRKTGAVQFPPSRISANRQAHLVDTQDPWPLAERSGLVATATQDTLAFSRNPPGCYGLVDFEGGGRLMMDFTDSDAADLAAGDHVRFVFRIKDIDVATGYRRYFWKAVSANAGTPHALEVRDAERA